MLMLWFTSVRAPLKTFENWLDGEQYKRKLDSIRNQPSARLCFWSEKNDDLILAVKGCRFSRVAIKSRGSCGGEGSVFISHCCPGVERWQSTGADRIGRWDPFLWLLSCCLSTVLKQLQKMMLSTRRFVLKYWQDESLFVTLTLHIELWNSIWLRFSLVMFGLEVSSSNLKTWHLGIGLIRFFFFFTLFNVLIISGLLITPFTL